MRVLETKRLYKLLSVWGHCFCETAIETTFISLNGGFSPNPEEQNWLVTITLTSFFGLCSRYFCKAGDTVHLRVSFGFVCISGLFWDCGSGFGLGHPVVIIFSVETCAFCTFHHPSSSGLLLKTFGFWTLRLHLYINQPRPLKASIPSLTPLSSSYSSFFNNQLIGFSLSCACLKVTNEMVY